MAARSRRNSGSSRLESRDRDRDVAPEATRDVIDREIPGIAEATRAAGLQKTRHAVSTAGGVPQDCSRIGDI